MPIPSLRGASKRGFTLVELLVVIGIIALLISILMPALTRARRSAQSLQCKSNMRQVALAILYYAQANKDWCPPAMQENSIWGDSVWSHRLYTYKYINNLNVLFCPNDVGYDAAVANFHPDPGMWIGNWPAYAWGHMSSYGLNVYFGIPYYNAPNPTWPWYRPFKDFTSKPILGEPWWVDPSLQRPFMQPDTLRDPKRHLGHTNLAFGDTHVETVSNDEVFVYGDRRWDPNVPTQ